MKRSIRVESVLQFQYTETEPGFVLSGEVTAEPVVLYVDRGSLHSVADGKDLLLKQGELVYYRPGQWRMQYADIDCAPSIVLLRFQAEAAPLSLLADRKLPASQAVTSLLQQMLQEQERMDPYASDFIITSLELLLLHLLRALHTPGRKPKTAYALHGENEVIRRAQQYVSAHVRERLSVPLVARKVDVSPSYLTALFQKHLSISPGEYIRRIKLQESKRLIREGKMNFTEIASALSYSTVHHFSRQFKDKFGMTPTEYAKSIR